jgi:NIMA (never in mitosis gene a)-related kinase
MSLKEKEKANALNEVRIIASIRHPNIICFKECFIDEELECLWYFLKSESPKALLWNMLMIAIC